MASPDGASLGLLYETAERWFSDLRGVTPIGVPTDLESITKADQTAIELRDLYVRLRNPDARSRAMPGTLDGKLITSSRTRGRKGLAIWLEDFVETAILPQFPFFTPASEYENDQEILPSLNMYTLPPEKKANVIRRIKEASSGLPTRLYTLLPIWLIALGKKHTSKPYVSICFEILKWMARQWNDGVKTTENEHVEWDECDDPPYGKVRVRMDTMSPKKIYLCINMAQHLSHYPDTVAYLETKGVDMRNLVHQYISYMCKSPYKAATKLKSHLGMAYMHCSVLATSGTALVVPNSDTFSGYNLVQVPPVPVDSHWYALYGATFNKYVEELDEFGLTELSNLMTIALTTPHGRLSIRLAAFVSGLRGIVGYVHSNASKTFATTYDHKEEHPLYKGVGLPDPDAKDVDGRYMIPSVPLVEESVYNVFRRLLSDDDAVRILSYRDFVPTIPRLLSQNSAGQGAIVLSGTYNKKEFEIKVTSKPVLYMVSPDSFRPPISYADAIGPKLTMDSVWKFYPKLTEETPGLTATRSVVAKLVRLIEMQPLGQMILEGMLFQPFYRLMMTRKPDTANQSDTYFHSESGLQMNFDVFTVGSETGNPYLDHVQGIIHTTSSLSVNEKTIFMCIDYSSYDETEKRQLRVPWSRGIVKAFDEKFGKEAAFPPFDNIRTLMEVLAPDRAIPYQLPDKTITMLDGVRSGEFATMLLNNTQNAAVTHTVLRGLETLGIGRAEYIRIQGDDLLMVVKISSDNAPLTSFSKEGIGSRAFNHLKTKLTGKPKTAQAAEVSTYYVNACGQDTNPDKGIIGSVYDYLKNRIIMGRLSPNNYAQISGSEGAGMSDSPGAFMTGQLQKGDLLVSRGYDPEIIHRYSLMLFLIRCSYRVRVTGSSADESNIYYPPPCMWYAPVDYGGLGRSPFAFPFAVGPAMLYYLKQCPEMMKYIGDRCAYFNAPNNRDVANDLANLMVSADKRTGDFTVTSSLKLGSINPADLKKPFSKGVSELSSSLNGDAISLSSYSIEKLRASGYGGIVPSDLFYTNSPKRVIKNILSNNGSLMEFASEMNRSISADVFTKSKRPSLSKEATWVLTHNVEFSEPVEPPEADMDGPLAFLHPSFVRFYQGIGWGSTTASAQKHITSMLTLIKADNIFPRDITDETIMRMLFQPDVVNNPSLAVDVLSAMGCSQDTLSKVATMFGSAQTNSILLSYVSSSFTLNSPMLTLIDRSKENLVKSVIDVFNTKSSKAVYPAMVLTWLWFSWKDGVYHTMRYVPTPESEKLVTVITPMLAIPSTPMLDHNRIFTERSKMSN